jgi:uncharacterized protein (TIGR00297 family)
MSQLAPWLIGLAASTAIAALAYWRRSLSPSGVPAAMIVGTVLYALGGAAWYVPLLAFFLTSSVLSHWRKRSKTNLESGYEKSGRRDVGQVFANGGVGVLLCIGHAIEPGALWWPAFVGVMATVNADTWATEIGGLSKRAPRSILTWRPAVAGASGAVSPLGLAASAFGALAVALAAWVCVPAAAALAGVGAAAGFAGALVDSLLGASVQRMFRCRVCGSEVEAATHCGHPAVLARGVRWLGNDAVNAASSAAGGLIAALLAWPNI